MYLSPWISLPLVMCISMVCGLNHFPPKLQVGKKHRSVNLTCDTEFQGPVTWKKTLEDQVKPVRESRYAHVIGRSLQLHSLDMPNAGKYSCWGEGDKLLDETYLLLEVEKREKEEPENGDDEDDDDDTKERDFICSSQTYSCSFSCQLFASGFTAARLRYHRDGQDPTAWQNATPAQNNFQFTLNLFHSPFAEESAALSVTAEAINSKEYLKKSLHFYLRDIIQPDPPKTVMCERKGPTLTVTVQPPDSWAQPVSYFPLEHEIEIIDKNNGKKERVTDGVIRQKVSMLRARSRDPLTPSNWSKWSPWKNVKSRKNKQRNKGMSGESVSLSFGKNDTVICRRKRSGRKTSRQQQPL